VSGAGDELALVDTLKHHHRQAKARNLESADAISLMHVGPDCICRRNLRDRCRSGRLTGELPRLVPLRDATICRGPAGVQQQRETAAQKESLRRQLEPHFATRRGAGAK